MATMPVSTLARLVAIATIPLAPIAALAQDLPESSPQALLHHAQGVDAYVKGANAEAIRHFLLAYESDPTSFVSLLMAGVAAGNAGQGARADSFYARVLPHKDKLSAYYRYRLEAQMAGRAGNPALYAELNRKAAELGAGTKAWYNIAQGINPRGQFGEAREALRKLSPDKEPMKGWYSYYSVYVSAAHQLGDHEDELQMARRARADFPGDIRPYELEAGALAALGRVAEAERVLAEVQAMKPQAAVSPGDILTNVAQEFMAHGNAAVGRRWLENSLKWHDALPADTARTINNRASRAYTLYLMGRAKDAAGTYASIAADAPATAVWKAWVGYMSALTGDRAKALEVSQQIEAGAINLGRVNGPLWRALIASGMNERDRALALFRESGTRALWMHRDPIVSRAMGAAWMSFLKESAE